ncbi:MAG: glutamate--tRNA ligase [Nanoarchaeota archaeon]|nr:glutamate--tRNA ligase [Nanoarchaeota archaeon]MBU1004715.1 glutamate--tRNA ligase [Nanoarchaeota archaeon]MBU1945761.1 glutamate--tRNA ligase [Nanoarchaeota archaeon]
MEGLIRKYALQNAVKFNGKANPGAVIGKIIAEKPELKKDMKSVAKKVNEIIKEIGKLSVNQQRKELEETAPELLEKKKEKKRNLFKFLGYKENDKVNTAFPPGPEKYPHIGHAKALLLNYMLARQYNGKFILRFEDTNPKLVKKEFYDIMIDNFKWLGVGWDELIYASDFMDMFYEKAELLIKKGFAYIDKSNEEEVKLSREKGIGSKNRSNSPEENLKLWQELKKAKKGSAILRLKIDLTHQNTTMRDPTIFRIIDEPHARQGKKYRVWPNYDFQNAVMDSYSNIDIRLRSKEFEMRSELQRWIQNKLGIKETKTYEFGRFNLTGVLSSGRIIREKIANKELVGWDDPSLTTLVALRRRGFLPEAIKNFVVSTGISKAEATMTWDDMIMHNKRLLDNIAPRYSAVFDPKEITIQNAPETEVELNINPNEKKGGRKIKVNNKFILSNEDIKNIKEGELIRLMDCLNAKKVKNKLIFESSEYEKGKGQKVINWLPAEGNVKIEVLMPDKQIMKGLAEHNVKSLKEGDIIQLERFGFCRLDRKEKDRLKFWFTHK